MEQPSILHGVLDEKVYMEQPSILHGIKAYPKEGCWLVLHAFCYWAFISLAIVPLLDYLQMSNPMLKMSILRCERVCWKSLIY